MSEQVLLCKAEVVDPKKGLVEFSGPANTGVSLEEQIQEDKKYGTMRPRNGQFFTWKAEDWQGKFITKRQIKYGLNFAQQQVELEIALDIKRWQRGMEPDFKISFRRTADDPELRSSTLMYHYYPINDIANPLRGLCVVNTDFPWTVHGNPISMYEIDPAHYPVDTPNTGFTYDFDQVYTHEFLHGLGLPHSPNKFEVMSPNYGIMAEFMTAWDKKRIAAKYTPRPWWKKHFYTRWMQFYQKRSDKY